MNEIDPLLTTLLDILYELQDANLPLLLGGGYGLYLKHQHVITSGARLLMENALPPVRATNDLDVFLQTEIITDSKRLRPLRSAIDRLGFAVIPSAQNYQFARKFTFGGREWEVKVDLLAHTPDRTQFPHIKIDERRIKPHPSVGIHAHRADEAIAIEEGATPLTVTGVRTTGDMFTGAVYLPSTYAHLMMKLFALRDQVDSGDKGYGRKHALDIYTLIAIMTEAEYEKAQKMSLQFKDTTVGQESGHIVVTLFADANSRGSQRLREHEAYPANADITEFITILSELFPMTIAI